MARIDTLANFLTDIAAAIKAKTGKTDPITPANFDTEITNISTGATPEIGYTIDKWDETGVPKELTIVGMTVIPKQYGASIPDYIEKIVLPDNLTTIDTEGLANVPNLVNMNIPDSLTKIQSYGLSGSSKLKIKTLNRVEVLNISSMQRNTAIVQLSMPYIKTIAGTAGSASYAPFRYCSNLKAVWVGSTIEDFDKLSLSDTDALVKIFIDLPRATVETFDGYATGFKSGGSSDIVVCNDDEGWMTLEEFDAFDWSTYSEA